MERDGPHVQHVASRMFEAQYNELALAVDSIAERIRALGYPAPGTYKEYARLSSIQEEDGVPEATEMIRKLVEGRGSRGAHRALDLPDGRRRQRRAVGGSADPAHARAHEKDRVDAALDAGLMAAATCAG
ncbi:Dps family protein [Cupriavidus basilensis]